VQLLQCSFYFVDPIIINAQPVCDNMAEPILFIVLDN